MALNQSPSAATTSAVVDDEVQLRYARLLDWGTRIGLVALLFSFVIYNTGMFPSHVPRHRLPELWGEPVARYLELTGAPTGWQWVAMLQHGDVLGFVGIAVLAGCSAVCLLSLLPLYLQRRDRAYLGLCLAQVAVLLVAAAGVLSGGH